MAQWKKTTGILWPQEGANRPDTIGDTLTKLQQKHPPVRENEHSNQGREAAKEQTWVRCDRYKNTASV